MELKLVYRVLRKISDWTVTDYYSDVYVEGQQNVPKEGPVIIASTHHNEIIDIATLAVTIPHRRHVSFWAKSTMFANPVAGAILSSSGAIPVKRNPNSGSSPPEPAVSVKTAGPSSRTKATNGEDLSRSALFRETSRALAEHQVVGVFPEGTSYTQASILQIMPGAAWAAVEYARYLHDGVDEWRSAVGEGKGKGKGKAKDPGMGTGLIIVPVAIVYTDKARYQSRISVRYGKPISMDSFANELFSENLDDTSKVIVKKVMAQVETQLREMTINAPDWDTICATSMARSILWGDENDVPLKDWVEISQRLVQIFVQSPDAVSADGLQSALHLKVALTKYYALLHYADIKHSILLSLVPLSTSSILDIPPPYIPPRGAMLMQPSLSLVAGLPLALIRLILFLPPLLLHLPGYITGSLAAKYLATPREEEGAAQFKAIGGGFGIGANIALSLGILWKQNKLGALATLFGLHVDKLSMLKRIAGLVCSVYFSTWLLVKWHKLLIRANYRQLQRLLTYRKFFTAFVSHRPRGSLSTAEVDVYGYTRPYAPAANKFIKRREVVSTSESDNQRTTSRPPQVPRPIPAWKLVRPLLQARASAFTALSSYLKTTEDRALLAYLSSKGANLSVSS